MTVSPASPVVVGVNGSPASLTAVRAAAGHARSHDAELRIVHVFNWLPTYDTRPRETAQAVLDEAVALAEAVAPGLTIRTRMLEGTPAALLLRESRMAALIAVGEGSLSHCTCPAVDACAVQVARRAWCNVLVTREHGRAEGPVVVGVDRCADAGRVLDVGFDEAACLGTEVVAVRVVDPDATEDQVEEETRRLEAVIAPRARSFGVTARPVLRWGDPTEVLRQMSDNAAVMVVGAHGDRPYGGMPGSVTQSLLQHCPAPLAVVRRQLSGLPAPRRPARTAPYDRVS
jgi:nucleotide-binding universal stress UspA family protein